MVEVFAANQGDCNSNNLEVLDATLSSYRSNASSQDNVDFFQDYSDYQWFADYRYICCYYMGYYYDVIICFILLDTVIRTTLIITQVFCHPYQRIIIFHVMKMFPEI